MFKLSIKLLSISALTLLLSGCISGILAGVGVGAAGANVAGSNLSVGQQASDISIRTRMLEHLHTLHTNKTLNTNSNVEITVFNGIVLLLGQVPTSAAGQNIAKYASHINGVRVVYNQLTIGQSEGLQSYLDDSWVTTKIKANFVGHVDLFHFKVITERGVVYLMALTTQAEGKLAAELAARTSGVKKVVEAYQYINEPSGDNTKYPSPIKNSIPEPTHKSWLDDL